MRWLGYAENSFSGIRIEPSFCSHYLAQCQSAELVSPDSLMWDPRATWGPGRNGSSGGG